MELLRPILELGVVIPGMLLAYFPAKSSLKQPLPKLVLWLAPLLALLCAAGGVVCYARRMPDCANACSPNLACSRDLHKNAPDLALEIRNDCVVRLCGICLYQQPFKSD